MYELNLADNITRLRHERKITQEDLADFLGVTKASVSKWENAQSTPDIMILLQLAAFFDITVDALLGYEPQLSREQIRRFYVELSKDFASRPSGGVTQKIRALAHRYYSCYPFLLQLCVLYLNHFMLEETVEKQQEILEEAVLWCGHIIGNCSDVGVCSDALVLKAAINLQLGRSREVIEALEPSAEPGRLAGKEGAILTQAYQMEGETKKAKSYIQLREYLDLVNLAGDQILSMSLYVNDLGRCEKTIQRVKGVLSLYGLEALHPNLAAQFYYQSAVVYGMNGKKEKALEAVGDFVKCVRRLLEEEEAVLHGDEYFDLLDAWIEKLPLGRTAPRDRRLVKQNLEEYFRHPAFDGIKETKEFERLVYILTKGGQSNA